MDGCRSWTKSARAQTVTNWKIVRNRWTCTRIVSSCLFLVVLCCFLGFGFCCDSFSIRVWYTCILIRILRTLISPFFVWGVRLVLVIVGSILCFDFFSSCSAPGLLEPVVWPRTALWRWVNVRTTLSTTVLLLWESGSVENALKWLPKGLNESYTCA